jgi:methionyl-tRNA formyltransferase
MTTPGGIVLLCGDGDSTRAVYQALRREFGHIAVIMEQRAPRWQMARQRARRLGYCRVVGQTVFVTGIAPILALLARRRIAEIKRQFGLDTRWDDAVIHRVETVNSPQTIELLTAAAPRLVVVHGTRIIAPLVLEAVDAPFINMHAGITPLYRGVHGGYWALVEGRPDLVGTTVHLVDKGIDTGAIIDQSFFSITRRDNFATYPYLHTAFGIPMLIKAARSCLERCTPVAYRRDDMPSKLRYHPTAGEYLWHRMTKGVR